MRILIIGGTKFLGRHLVQSALEYRHEVTLFNRGLTNPDLFPQVETIIGETYGPLKALCEQAVEDIFGRERTLIVRPGLIVGPYDPTDRFTYWPVRLAAGGDVLAPGDPEAPVQFVDARDLAAW